MIDIERGAISKLLETRDLKPFKDAQVKPSFFTGDHLNAYRFIEKTFAETGEAPTLRVFRKKFQAYRLDYLDSGEEKPGTEEPAAYWISELRKKAKHNSLVAAVRGASEQLKGMDADAAFALLKKEISFVSLEVEETKDVDITKGTESRKQAYLERKMSQGIKGLATGIRGLDYLFGGFEDETLTVLIAKTGVGKTWLQIVIGAHLMLQSCKVLHLGTEMSTEIMRQRYEALLFALAYGSFNYNQFRRGDLPPEKERQFYEFLESDLPELEPLILGTATSVSGVSAYIEKYSPDIVMIDSVYLMEDDLSAKDDWLRVAHITRGLKMLNKRHRPPIVITTQADKNTSKKTGPELDSIMYTQAIGQDADAVYAIFRDDIMKEDSEMCIKALKQREGSLGKLVMGWDFERMDFSDIYLEGSGGAAGESENTVELAGENA
jgi:replicative DNA helicase